MTNAQWITGCIMAACTLLALGACCSTSKSNGGQNGTALKVLTESDAKSKVTVAVGSSFDVQLSANATTGYAWSLIQKDGPSVEQKGEMEYVSNPHPEGMTGVGGIATFHFIAKNAGVTTLQFGYSRPWEKVAPIKTYTVTIEAK